MTQSRQKFFGVPLQKAAVRTNSSTLMVRGFFTSDRTDEVGDIITRGATERAVPKYRQWSNIRYMHQPRPVGKVRRIGVEDGLEWNEVEIEVIDPQAVFEVENGLLAALSVGIFFGSDDFEFLEGGGLLINNYTLAEISLVDHPGNYDAFLRAVPVEETVRTLVRAYGVDSLREALQKNMEGQLDMEPKENPVETAGDDVAPVADNQVVADAPVTDEPVAAEVSDEPVAGAVEEPVTAEVPDESVVAEAANPANGDQADAPVFDPAAALIEQLQHVIDENTERMNNVIADGLAAFAKATEAFTTAVAEVTKTLAEVRPTEQPTGVPATSAGSDTGKDAGIDAESNEPEHGAPANRKDAVAPTSLPEASVEDKQTAASLSGDRLVSLRQSLHRRFLGDEQ